MAKIEAKQINDAKGGIKVGKTYTIDLDGKKKVKVTEVQNGAVYFNIVGKTTDLAMTPVDFLNAMVDSSDMIEAKQINDAIKVGKTYTIDLDGKKKVIITEVQNGAVYFNIVGKTTDLAMTPAEFLNAVVDSSDMNDATTAGDIAKLDAHLSNSVDLINKTKIGAIPDAETSKVVLAIKNYRKLIDKALLG